MVFVVEAHAKYVPRIGYYGVQPNIGERKVWSFVAVFRRLLVLYTIAGATAGAAGALSAQTNAVVGLDSLSFALSAEGLVMLILGGAGRLTGALVGAAVFTVLHHTAASINPYHWLFVVGALLMLVVLIPPAKLWAAVRRRLGAKS